MERTKRELTLPAFLKAHRDNCWGVVTQADNLRPVVLTLIAATATTIPLLTRLLLLLGLNSFSFNAENDEPQGEIGKKPVIAVIVSRLRQGAVAGLKMNQEEFRKLAQQDLTSEEMRTLVDDEKSDASPHHDDLRLVLAADMLCDAALEVSAAKADYPTMQKLVAFSNEVTLDLDDMAVVTCLRREAEVGHVSDKELNLLLSRSSFVGVIANAVEQGADLSELDGATIALSPIGLIAATGPQEKKKSLLGRFFGK